MCVEKIGSAWSALWSRGPQSRVFLALCESGAAAFLASFGPFWVRVGVRVRVRVRVRVGSTPVPWSHQEMLPSPRNKAVPEQPTP